MEAAKIARPWTSPGTPGPSAPTETAAVAPADDGHLHKPGFVPGDIIGIFAGLLLLAFFGLQLQSAYAVLFGDGGGAFTVRAVDLWFNSALLFFVLGVLPWLWVLTTRRGGWQGMIDYFGLGAPGRPMLLGLALGVGLVIALLIVGLIMQLLGTGGENAAIGPIQAIMTLPLALAISVSAAVGEEILFRGVIQKHIGVVAQAIVFGLLHAYQGVYGIIVTALLALLFGYIVKYRRTLWIPIVAHFTFDFIQLVVLLAAPEMA